MSRQKFDGNSFAVKKSQIYASKSRQTLFKANELFCRYSPTRLLTIPRIHAVQQHGVQIIQQARSNYGSGI